MAGIYPQIRKGEDKPYAYNIRVYRGNSKKPIQMTWRIPDNLRSEKKIQQELNKIVGEFETACRHGIIPAGKQTVSDYLDKYLKAQGTKFTCSMQSLINEYLGDIKLQKLTNEDLDEFYNILMSEPVRRDLKARAKEALIKVKKGKGISHAKLCQMADLSDNTIRLMCQQKNVAIESAKKVAKVFDMTYEELFDTVTPEEGGKPCLSVKSVREYHNFLHAVLDQAMEEGLIYRNPADRANPPRVERKKRAEPNSAQRKYDEIMDRLACDAIASALYGADPSPDCQKCYAKCLSAGDDQMNLLTKCKDCPLFNAEFKIVNRLEYELFEKKRDERIEIKKKKGDAWNDYTYLKGFFEFLKREDRASIKDLEQEYRNVLDIQKEIGGDY